MLVPQYILDALRHVAEHGGEPLYANLHLADIPGNDEAPETCTIAHPLECHMPKSQQP